MKILLFTPQLPYPPHQGTTIRNYNLIRELAQRHTIDLLTFLAPGESLAASQELQGLCRRINGIRQPVRSIARRARDTLGSPLPDMALRLESPEMHQLVAAWTQAETYDIVQVEGIEMAQYGVAAMANKRPGTQQPILVFDDHNCEYLLQKRNALTDLRQPRRWVAAAYSLVQWQKLVHYESQICRQAAAILAVSEADKLALQTLVPVAPITVVSNGIQMAAYPFAAAEAVATPPALVFTGKMDYRPNIDAVLWFGRDVLPLIQAQEPHVRFQIVGMNPHARLDALRANPAIEITGAVPDAQTYIQKAAVYVIPMRVGGGTRFKALEAMAAGKGIVSTRLGVEGIQVQDEREMLLADTPATFAEAVLRLLRDARQSGKLNDALGRQARGFVATHYDWSQIMPRLEAAYADALAQ
ncbi:MAG: glycosyltransferase [Chloroflexi bacterium]|nr:glycosyltransferase [Chloroflexota bacterium]